MREHRHIFLTGATGALGPTLCAQLLRADATQKLSLLIRRDENGLRRKFSRWKDRLLRELTEQGGIPDDWEDRILPVEGDLRAEGLGLSRIGRRSLVGSIDGIVHAAADTQFAGRADDQWNTNVCGTRRILDLARACRQTPRIILVSTVCTSGTTTGRILEAPLHPRPTFVNQYEHTKWQAEELALADPLPLAIARVAIVLGSHARGTVHRMGAVHHLLRWFGRRLIPVLPAAPAATLDVIATETVGRFLARAVSADWSGKPIWNIAAGDQAPSFREFCQLVWNRMFPAERMRNLEEPGKPFIVDQETFEALRRSRNDRSQRLIQQALSSISTFVPMLLHPRTYDTTQAEQLWGGPLPLEDWRQTLSQVLRHFRATRRAAIAA
ncbi:MAG: SDR family oxidoreductase [Phycisphaerae bacterium]|nr:SDR family oxidoreductase [Phycisphaerae bacterium]MDW8263067.1 SDR family oxidoreductase [Phycisphaerales bacterium]